MNKHSKQFSVLKHTYFSEFSDDAAIFINQEGNIVLMSQVERKVPLITPIIDHELL